MPTGAPTGEIVHQASRPPVRLELLHCFGLTCDGRQVALPIAAQRVLAYLALRDRPQGRLTVADALWVDAPSERSSANLRSTLWRLRRARHALVESVGSLLRLAPTVSVDVRDVERRARRLIDPNVDSGGLDLSAERLDSDLLPDWYEDWVLVERERLRQLRLHALEALAERLTAAGRHAEAVGSGLAAVQAEPLRESAQRVLIAAHLAEGNRYEALRQYRAYCRAMREELGLGPSRLVSDLVRDLLSPAVDAPATPR